MTNQPSESTTETRPSDEMTAGVVARWYDFDIVKHRDSHGIVRCGNGYTLVGSNEDDDIPSILFMKSWPGYADGGIGDSSHGFVHDPRDDTDAALDLLHGLTDYLDIEHKDDKAMYVMSHGFDGKGIWTIWDSSISNDYHSIPLSGQPFRYAVVRLAAKVMGIEGTSND